MKNETKIENLIFDVGGVIILNQKVNFEKIDEDWLLPKGTTRDVIGRCFNKESLSDNVSSRNYFEENFSDLLSFEQYKEILQQIFESEKINETLIKWIQKKRESYTISLLTNNTASLKKVLKDKFNIYESFDYIFNSAEIGLSKPDHKIFEYTLKKLKTTPEKCLFIDDNPVHIKAAKQLGFNVILFTENPKFFKEINKYNFNLKNKNSHHDQ